MIRVASANPLQMRLPTTYHPEFPFYCGRYSYYRLAQFTPSRSVHVSIP